MKDQIVTPSSPKNKARPKSVIIAQSVQNKFDRTDMVKINEMVSKKAS